MREHISEPRIDVFDPRHNARQIAKELTLLEDHLRHPPQHCPDCVRKHILKAEAYADEAISLDKDGTYSQHFDRAGAALRSLAGRYGSANTHSVEARRAMAQNARVIRKKMGKLGFVSPTVTSQTTPRRVMLRSKQVSSSKRVQLGRSHARFGGGNGPLALVGQPGWVTYPGFVRGGPLDFTPYYRSGRSVVTCGGVTRIDPLVTNLEMDWFLGETIGVGQGDAFGCRDINPTNDYEITSIVAADPNGSGVDVTFVNRVSYWDGSPHTDPACPPVPGRTEGSLTSCQCNVVLPRMTVTLPFISGADAGTQIWDDVFPQPYADGIWNFYSSTGSVLASNTGLMSPGFGGMDWGGGRWLMTRLVQGVVSNKMPSLALYAGWGNRRRRVDTDIVISRLVSIGLISIGACTSTMLPTYTGTVLETSSTGQNMAYPGRVGLIPLPAALYPPAIGSYQPKEDPIISLLLAMKEATKDHESPTSGYAMYLAPLVERLIRDEDYEPFEWTYGLARAIGFTDEEAKRFELSTKFKWGVRPPRAGQEDPRTGGGVPELLRWGGDNNQTQRIVRDIDDIYRNPRRQSEKGDVVQANEVWAAKTRMEQNLDLLPPLVLRDAQRSGYPMEPIDGAPVVCTPESCNIDLISLYRGWPSQVPLGRLNPSGTPSPARLPLAQSPEARAIIEENYADLMTVGDYTRDHMAYNRAWFWAMLLNDPCKEAAALEQLKSLVPGTQTATAAELRLAEIRPQLVRVCEPSRFPVGLLIGTVAGLGIWRAYQKRK